MLDMIYIGVPCSGCKEESIIPCTREDEAVAIAVGMNLCGIDNIVVFMQNSGYGHCLDIMTSLALPYNIIPKVKVYEGSNTPQHKLMNKIYIDLENIIFENAKGI